MARQELQTMEKKEVVVGRDVGVESAITQAETDERLKYFIATQPKNRRAEVECQARILKAVKLVEFAQMCFYSYPRGGKDIFGALTQHLAAKIAYLFCRVLSGQNESCAA